MTSFCSMIWTSKNHKYWQISIFYSDIIIINIKIFSQSFLIISIYILCSLSQKIRDEENFSTQLKIISNTVIDESFQIPDIKLILAEKFNQ